MDLRLEPVTMPLAEPLRTSYGEVRERELVLVELEGDDGVVGRGEAAPLEPYDGVSLEAVRAVLARYADAVAALDGRATGLQILEACRAVDELPQALAAIDLAVWDRAGRREGRPVAVLLADGALEAVPVNATIGAVDRAGAATAAAAADAAGFPCVKLKVGLGDDAGRVAAVRAAAPEIALRLDANGAWEPDEAVRMIAALAPAGLELVEEPVHGLAALRDVRERVPVRVAMDETAAIPGALASGAADAVCLKISRAGGISGLLAQAALVRATGADVYLASTLDGPLGIAAAVHCAAALRVDLPCGLAAAAGGGLPVSDGAIAVPTAPGLLA